MEMMLRFAILFLLYFMSQMSFAMVSPPQYFYAHTKATLGQDPCVKLSDLTQNALGQASFRMEVCSAEKAQALNKILKRFKTADDQPPLLTIDLAGPDGQSLQTPTLCTVESLEALGNIYREAL